MFCKDCKYWKRNDDFPDSRFGACEKAIDVSGDTTRAYEDNLLASRDFEDYQSYVQTGQNFGCIHYKEDDEE